MRLADKIRRGRQRAKLTQEELAGLMGVSKSAVNLWENPRQGANPSIERLAPLADCLGMTLDELLRDAPGHIQAVREDPSPYNLTQLTPEEHRALTKIRSLPKKRRHAIVKMIETL